MNNLEKLIEQYERELEIPKDEYYKFYTAFNKQTRFYIDAFVQWLASRPTCGVEQRKFLDEMEKNSKLQIREEGGIVDTKVFIYDDACLTQYDFTADLQKVIKGE